MNRDQHGFNLISLMVGTTLSLIGIMAMLSLYKNLISNAAIATQDARQDGQVASARLTLQRELHSAGYGMNAVVNTDLVLLKSAALTSGSLSGTQINLPSSEKGNALLWRYQSGNSVACQGVLSSGGALSALSATNCNGALASLSWTSTPLISAPASGLSKLDSFSSAVDGEAFSLAYVDCWPYQKEELLSTSHLTVTVMTNLTASTAGSSAHAEANQATFCLPNFPSI